MELRQLQSFMAVVKHKNFTKAAKKLYISQPTISTHIRMLEEELQLRLMIRTTKNVKITIHGIELYEYACKVFELRDELLERWTEENNKIIRLGVSTIPADYILPEILPVFRKQHKDVQFHIHQSDSQEIINGLLNGSYSIGLVGMESHKDQIKFIPFYKDHIVMITPNDNYFSKLVNHNELLLDTIMREPIILREKGSGSKKCLESYLETMEINEDDLNVVARLNSQEAIKKLVSSGLGISFISEKAVYNDQNEGKLLSFILPKESTSRNLYIAYRKDYVMKKHTIKFIDFVKEFYT